MMTITTSNFAIQKYESDLKILLRVRTGLAFYDEKLTELWNDELRPLEYLLNELQDIKKSSMSLVRHATQAVIASDTRFLQEFRESLIDIENTYIELYDMVYWQARRQI